MNHHLLPLTRLAEALIDQHAARIVVRPQEAAEGFWFGGGNLLRDADGTYYMVGRYRNQGDSRTGLARGERGLELTLFRSRDLVDFTPLLRWSKADLSCDGREVLSIEGSSLRRRFDGQWELFVSVEFHRSYPDPVASYQKPGAGVWSILQLQAADLPGLAQARPTLILESHDPAHLHVKDPFVYQPAQARSDDDIYLGFCSHPFNWSSSNTCLVRRSGERWAEPLWECVPRGPAWDVAITRTTSIVDIPPQGAFREGGWSLLFYDGGECVRALEPHAAAVARPRGYSCEELGGAAAINAKQWDRPWRLSPWLPQFVSPWGAGCSRYVNVCVTEEAWIATWQQSQPDRSQPLVLRRLPIEDVDRLLRSEG